MSQIFFKLSVELVKLELNVVIPTSNPIELGIKVGSQTLTTQNELRFDQKDLDINEQLSFCIPLYQNKNQRYQQKMMNIQIVNLTNNLRNKMGVVKFDISQYADQENQRIFEQFQIEKSQYRGKLSLYITCQHQIEPNETNNNIFKSHTMNTSKSPISKRENKSPGNELTRSHLGFTGNVTPDRISHNNQIIQKQPKTDLKKAKTELKLKETEEKMKDQSEQLNITLVQNEQLKADLEEMKQDNDKLQTDIQLLDDQNKQQDGYIQVLQEQIKQLQNEQKCNSQISQEVERQEQLIQQICQKVDASEEDVVVKLSQQIADSQLKDQSINHLNNQVNQLQQQISDLNQSLQQKCQQQSETEDKLKMKEQDVKQQQMDHENSITKMKQQNNQNIQKIKDLEQENQENVDQYLKNKQLLGDIINLIFEEGIESLMEKVEQKMF